VAIALAGIISGAICVTDAGKTVEGMSARTADAGNARKVIRTEGISLAIRREAQERYCAKKRVPLFAPSNGICSACKKQIYDRFTMIQASREHITGCPYCDHSYCE
jgi:hypothetical protein